MASGETLRRLGGGRWETKDGRFSVEPQSGTWVLVDNSQANELGLPLVRGPYGSLAEAREAIEEARESGPAESPLAERIRAAPEPAPEPRPEPGRKAKKADRAEPPPEPKWLRDLSDGERRKAKALIKRLEGAGVEDAERIARAEIADGQPALARLALERRLAEAAGADDPAAAVARVVDVLLAGRDPETGARWRLADGEGREIRELDVGLD